MRLRDRVPDRIQRHPAVRLRREAWGGFAFQRETGDLLELDRPGFDAVRLLGEPRTGPELCALLRARGHKVTRAETIGLLRNLEAFATLRRAAPSGPPLPCDPLAEDPVIGDESQGLRAPIVAHWAVTYRCNLSCAFCYAESGPGREPEPAPAVRRRIVERLAAWGVLEVAIGGGEPTVLPDLPELLAAIRAAGMVPNVTTNGTLHRPDIIEALATYCGVVHLSADRPDRLDAARGPGVFDRLRRTARDLAGAGARIGVNLLLTPDNVHDLWRSLDEALYLGARSITLLRPKGDWARANWPGFPSDGDLEAAASGIRAFVTSRPSVRLYVDTAMRGEWAALGLFEDPEPEVAGCGGGQRHVAVTPKGDVFPCSHARHAEYLMGNLLLDDDARIWSRGPGGSARRRYIEACLGVRCACRVGAASTGIDRIAPPTSALAAPAPVGLAPRPESCTLFAR
jgi:MoaA/NifB/PqqE/SkfB family radical SAM enzyme